MPSPDDLARKAMEEAKEAIKVYAVAFARSCRAESTKQDKQEAAMAWLKCDEHVNRLARAAWEAGIYATGHFKEPSWLPKETT